MPPPLSVYVAGVGGVMYVIARLMCPAHISSLSERRGRHVPVPEMAVRDFAFYLLASWEQVFSLLLTTDPKSKPKHHLMSTERSLSRGRGLVCGFLILSKLPMTSSALSPSSMNSNPLAAVVQATFAPLLGTLSRTTFPTLAAGTSAQCALLKMYAGLSLAIPSH